MPHTKVANRQKRRTKAVPVLGAAGLSFSLVAGTPAAAGSITPDPATSMLVGQLWMEEELIPRGQLGDIPSARRGQCRSAAADHAADYGHPRRLRGRPLFSSEPASGQRASLSGATAQISASTSRAQIQAVVNAPRPRPLKGRPVPHRVCDYPFPQMFLNRPGASAAQRVVELIERWPR